MYCVPRYLSLNANELPYTFNHALKSRKYKTDRENYCTITFENGHAYVYGPYIFPIRGEYVRGEGSGPYVKIKFEEVLPGHHFCAIEAPVGVIEISVQSK